MCKFDNKYNYKSFLDNDKFVKWMLFKTEEFDNYWRTFLKENPESRTAFTEAVSNFKHIRLNDYRMGRRESEALLQLVLEDTYLLARKKRIKLIQYISVAATVAVLLVSVAVYTHRGTNDIVNQYSAIGTKLPDENVQLISGGQVMALGQNAQLSLSDEGALSIDSENLEDDKKIALVKDSYSKLIVPFGKRSSITLSDGTKVWLNAGTQLEFPSQFVDNNRKIRVDGEVYLEVAHDESKPFVVEANDIEVRVLGTKFNMSTYNDESEKSIVLVDGSVQVKIASELPIQMTPNQLLQVDAGKAKLQQVDVSRYISWKDGYLTFHKMPYTTILAKIEKHYNVSFKRDNVSDIFTKTYSGRLILSDDIDNVMKSLSIISSTTYKRENNMYYINEKAS